ncbi:siderophore-interacting protein [Actinoplanes sp. L3-i22]|uniref:siderophore-interacting protein n=1 Tax=Actinoplanes sp. L3-i22 TaxID=2836373 RepID=UPI00210564AE|nr:siderophore-interacting protein [Actinoplanes sp. L3-i22]
MVRRAPVRTVTAVTPSMVQIGLSGPALRDLAWQPGQHLTVLPGSPAGLIEALRKGWRSYTIWDYDPRGAMELRVVTHGHDGPGARWAASVRVGDAVAVTPPEGRLTVRGDAPYHLVVGEETGSVAMGAILRAVPGGVPVHGVIEVDTPDDRPDLPRGAEIDWAYRNGASAASSPALLGALKTLRLPEEPGVAYVAGEARTCQKVRAHLIHDRGWPRADIRLHAFWTA